MARPSAAGSFIRRRQAAGVSTRIELRPDSRTAALITAITGGSAGHNLGILMRLLIGAGTPRGAAARARACLFFGYTGQAVAIILVAASRDGFAILVTVAADPRLIRTGLQQRAAKADARYAPPWYADSARSGRWPERRAARVRRCGCRSFRARRSCRGRWSTAAPR
jgi:hypothetical protein